MFKELPLGRIRSEPERMEPLIESGCHLGWVSDLYMCVQVCMCVSDTREAGR